MIAAHKAEQQSGASVIIAPFGPSAKLIAEEVRSALIFDISQSSPIRSRPENLVALPYALFFTADPEGKDESLRIIGRIAAKIVLETIRHSAPGHISSPRSMIDAMARRRFSSKMGDLSLNRNTGTFQLVR